MGSGAGIAEGAIQTTRFSSLREVAFQQVEAGSERHKVRPNGCSHGRVGGQHAGGGKGERKKHRGEGRTQHSTERGA